MSNKDIKCIEETSGEDNTGNDFYDWLLVPVVYPEERKTGVTFKGDSEEYLKAHGIC